MKHILDIRNWALVSRGFYRYVVAADVCYEIHLIKHYLDKPFIKANANLYLVGDWRDATQQVNYFERQLLCENKSVEELLAFAKKDFEENMK